MRKKLNLITTCALMAGFVFAQQGFDGVDDIMNELMNYTEEPAPEAEKAASPAPAVSSETPPKTEKQPAPIGKQDEAPPARENAASTAPVEKNPVPSRVEDSAARVDSSAPIEKEPEMPSEEDIRALAAAANMTFDEILLLIDQANQGQQEALDALRALAELIENDPELADRTNLLTWLKNAPGASWTWVKNTSAATGALIKKTPEATREYLERLRKDRDQRKRLDSDHKTAKTDGLSAVDAAWSTDLVLRTYELVANAGERMRLSGVTSAVDVESLFSVVDFPKGASAIYQPETGTMYVNNTLENLAVLETMLETMGILKGYGNAEQVEIEAKFIEVSEGTLEELGFQWNFEPDPYPIGNSDYTFSDGPDGVFAESLRGSPPNSTLPFDRKIDLGDGAVSAGGDWSTFRFVDTFNTEPSSMKVKNQGGNTFEVLITALDQNTGADVLSAPRILTRNGEEATIQVGDIHYFPEVYEGDGNQSTIVNVSYEDFTETLLGVELTVTPKVTADRDIMIQLNPRISELVGWQTYQLAPADSLYNHRQLDNNNRYTHDPIIANLPILKRREIQTQVTMADGSTIGMGGLINEKVEEFDDRVPLFGSLPLVGRLFRNEGERVVKRNLLMFVTAKIVDPNGRVDSSRSVE